MRLVFIDQTSQYDHHQVFNSSMADILMDTFQSIDLTCYGIASNQKSMYGLMREDKRDGVKFIPIEYPKTPKSMLLKAFVYPIKEWIRFLNFRHIFKKYHSKEDVIFLSITTFTSFYFYRWFASRSKAHVLCVLHGDMDYLYKAEGWSQKMNAWVHRKILNFNEQVNFKYILLNKVTKAIFLKDQLLTENEILDIYNPIVSELKDVPLVELQYPLLVGHIGSMEIRRKGSQLLYSLAEQLRENEGIDFRTIGLVTPEMIPLKNEYVREISGNKSDDEPFYLSRKDYVKELLELDYVLFFLPKDEYVMRASGAVLDSIDFLKPIIALRHPLFEFFEKEFGSIGHLCDSLDEMQELMQDITKQPEKYLEIRKQQIENIKKLKHYSSKEQVAVELRAMLKAKGWDSIIGVHA